mmetsp:Transcript_42301/g.111897  ORF Transcript_42301/g.111897 Transcript_42301/m.111897 type:complete len:579 (+) Transcript_42301:425-2161(+)
MVVLLSLQHLALQLPDLARQLGQLGVHRRLRLVVGALLLEVLNLHLLEVLPHGSQSLDLRCQLVLRVLQLGVDLLHDAGDLVERLALCLVHLRLLYRGLLEHRLRLPHPGGSRILGLQELLRPDKHRNLVPQLAQLRLEPLELRRLVPQGRRVVFELVALHELVPLHLLVLALLRGELVAQSVALLLQLLLVGHHELLLLCDEVGLLLVDGQARVLVLLVDLLLQSLDLGLHLADFRLQLVDIISRDWRVPERRVDVLEPLDLLVALPADPGERLPTLLDLAPKHLQHSVGTALAVRRPHLLHLAQSSRPLDVHVLRLLELVALLGHLLGEPGLLLLLLAEHGGDLQQHLEALVLLRLGPQVLNLLLELLPLGVELRNLTLQVRGVHPALPLLLDVRVRRLELRLQLLVLLVHLVDPLLAKELLRNLHVHAELGQVRAPPERLQVGQQPEQDGVHCVLVAGYEALLELDVKGALVSKDVEELGDPLVHRIGLVLEQVHVVLRVEEDEHLLEDLHELERLLLVKPDQRQLQSEGLGIEPVHDLLELHGHDARLRPLPPPRTPPRRCSSNYSTMAKEART